MSSIVSSTGELSVIYGEVSDRASPYLRLVVDRSERVEKLEEHDGFALWLYRCEKSRNGTTGKEARKGQQQA
jgi:hypothetical protein